MAAAIADSHAHLQLLADPALSLARAGMHNVEFVETIVDIWEDGDETFDGLQAWQVEAIQHALGMEQRAMCSAPRPSVPRVRIATGCHPHNAKHYDDALEQRLRERLRDPRVSAVGEIGLDYHYDLSPRDAQLEAFRRQVRVAKEAGLPVILHLREAHDDAYALLREEGFPEAGTLVHCFNLDAAELARWVDADCYIAFGGALTFKKADEVREAARLVPADRLLLETDAPYMTPEPLRGTACGPEHVVFTAARLADVRGAAGEDDPARWELLAQTYRNALALLDRAPTPWQEGGR
ncbi:MAG: TatD family hydrolase [Eggerthellaceae bacterium]|nr:TatD family hydrolase [Eggerthellaceae bacterium]